MKKRVLAVSVASALGVAITGAAHSAAITQIVVEDVGSTVGGAYNATLDGNSGGFRFNVIDPETYKAVSGWTGDVGTGAVLFGGAANATGSFSTGFNFSGSPFVPYTYGAGANGDITGTTLTLSSLDWGGNFAGAQDFNLPPDAGSLQVNWVTPVDATTSLVSFQWSHVITSADDPSGYYVGFNARWIVEGTATTQPGGPGPVPVPAAAWLMGSGLAGLAAVARRRRKKS